MKYSNVIKGKFKSRPNRFIANVEINGVTEVCHVKNTGRCKELLRENATVYLNKSDNPSRKTKYDLIAVEKNGMLVNIDSQVVNSVCIEYLPKMFDDIIFVKPEYKYGNSRFDIYVETDTQKILVECKGVTLEKDGVVLFPDAPTERGCKHLKELQKAVRDGYKAYAVFVIQMSGVTSFKPNKETHREFAEELKRAKDNGVNVLAFDCTVTKNEIRVNKEIAVELN